MKDGVLNIDGTPVKLQHLPDYYYAEPFSRGGDTGCRAAIMRSTGNLARRGRASHHQDLRPPQFDNTQVFTVPAGHYFMMGDNRDDSADSRDATSGVGYVPAENLVGRAQFIFYSTDGYAAWWETWKWPFTVRYDRLLMAIH